MQESTNFLNVFLQNKDYVFMLLFIIVLVVCYKLASKGLKELYSLLKDFLTSTKSLLVNSKNKQETLIKNFEELEEKLEITKNTLLKSQEELKENTEEIARTVRNIEKELESLKLIIYNNNKRGGD